MTDTHFAIADDDIIIAATPATLRWLRRQLPILILRSPRRYFISPAFSRGYALSLFRIFILLIAFHFTLSLIIDISFSPILPLMHYDYADVSMMMADIS